MSIITRMRKQTCVYWALKSNESGGLDYDDYGQPQYTSLVELTVRWDDTTEEFVDAEGTRQAGRALVYPGQDVDVGGMLMLGVTADATSPTDPKANDGAWEIRRFDKIPNLRATEFLRIAYL